MGPAPRGSSGTGRRLALLGLATAVTLAVAALLAGPALADAISPDAGPTQNAIDTDTLYKIVFFMAVAVIALVWGFLFYSLYRFPARRWRRAPQIFGNARLELAWTIGAGMIVVVIAIVTYIELDNIKNPVPSGPAALAEARTQNASLDQPPPPGGKSLPITVSGQQYIWRYQYPNGAVSFQQMVVPKDVTVILSIKANDVAHSWWIPELGGKFDALPGYTNHTWFKATKTGTFTGQCAELCGSGHAVMSAKVTVVEPNQYQAWVDNQKRLIQQAQKEVATERSKFQSQGAG
jgi:cytochrome c oxidase subunit II